jgi:hypothetical protein
MCPYLFDDLRSERGASIEHRQDNTFDYKLRVEAPGDQFDVPSELADSLERVVLALDRN